MIRPIGLIEGHYECRSFAETLPVFTDLLAMEVVEKRGPDELVLKHPNSRWPMVFHEAGAQAKDKPVMNHYGWRVRSREEVDRAYEYVKSVKDRYGLPRVVKPTELHIAYSFYFVEPGGNWLEVEHYPPDAARLSAVYGAHWASEYPEERFAGKGYVVQGLSHGTLEVDNLEASRRFVRDGLGLEIVPLPPDLPVFYLKDRGNPWYVVGIIQKKRNYLNENSRLTLRLESVDAVHRAHAELSGSRDEFGITEIDGVRRENGRTFFFLSDLDRNWWELAAFD